MSTHVPRFQSFSGNILLLRISWLCYSLYDNTNESGDTPCPGGGGGGGGTQVQRWAASALRISRKKGSLFKTSACPRFCKRRVLYFFVQRYEVWGSKSPYNPRNIRGSDAEWLPK